MSVHFFEISSQGPRPWGLAEEVIVNAFGHYRDDSTGVLHIRRTGPVSPPLTDLGSSGLVVTSAFKEWLLTEELGRFEFRPVVKEQIVKMDWHLWDEASDIDIPMNEMGEAYLMSLPHSEEASNELGDLWEWIIEPGAILDLDIPRSRWVHHRRIHFDTWNGMPIFCAKLQHGRGDGFPIATDDAKDRILRAWPNYWCFEPCTVL